MHFSKIFPRLTSVKNLHVLKCIIQICVWMWIKNCLVIYSKLWFDINTNVIAKMVDQIWIIIFFYNHFFMRKAFFVFLAFGYQHPAMFGNKNMSNYFYTIRRHQKISFKARRIILWLSLFWALIQSGWIFNSGRWPGSGCNR